MSMAQMNMARAIPQMPVQYAQAIPVNGVSPQLAGECEVEGKAEIVGWDESLSPRSTCLFDCQMARCRGAGN